MISKILLVHTELERVDAAELWDVKAEHEEGERDENEFAHGRVRPFSNIPQNVN